MDSSIACHFKMQRMQLLRLEMVEGEQKGS